MMTADNLKKAPTWAAGALLLLYVILAVSATTQESNTFDEAEHLTTGYLYWVHSEEKLNPGIGVLAQTWAAVPLLFDHLKFVPGAANPPANMSQWAQGYRFFYLMGNDPTKFLLQARFMIALLGAALGALVYFWSRELFGPTAGLISLLLFAFSPTMLAHGALVTADMAAALCFFAATLCFWRLTHTVSIGSLSLSILAFVGLTLAKMSAGLILPIYASILLVRILSKKPVEFHFAKLGAIKTGIAKAAAGALLLLAHGLVAIGVLRLVYRFNYFGWDVMAEIQKEVEAPGFSPWNRHGLQVLVLETLGKIKLLPDAYMEGFSHTLRLMARGGSLLGSHSTGSFWFFPVAFLVKTPISTLVLILLSLTALAIWNRNASKPSSTARYEPRCPSLYDLSPLLILGGFYSLACLTSHLNIGHRHLLPVYPVLFVFAGANAYWLLHGTRFIRAVVAVLLLGVAVESLSVRPHYLAFFNQFVGGPSHGYRYLVDSSLDWGQDLPGLGKWLDRNAPTASDTRLYLSYFGTGDPEYYGIKSLKLPSRFLADSSLPVPLQAGIYCISATSLQGALWTKVEQDLYPKVEAEVARWDATWGHPEARKSLVRQQGAPYWVRYLKVFELLQFERLCHYLGQREPDDEVGYSILIYRLSDNDIQAALGAK